MGTRLIFRDLNVVTVGVNRISLLDWRCGEAHPGNSSFIKTVPETDTGGMVEHTKALERTILTELGKMHP